MRSTQTDFFLVSLDEHVALHAVIRSAYRLAWQECSTTSTPACHGWMAELGALIAWRGRAAVVDLLSEQVPDMTTRSAMHLVDVVQREGASPLQRVES